MLQMVKVELTPVIIYKRQLFQRLPFPSQRLLINVSHIRTHLYVYSVFLPWILRISFNKLKSHVNTIKLLSPITPFQSNSLMQELKGMFSLSCIQLMVNSGMF